MNHFVCTTLLSRCSNVIASIACWSLAPLLMKTFFIFIYTWGSRNTSSCCCQPRAVFSLVFRGNSETSLAPRDIHFPVLFLRPQKCQGNSIFSKDVGLCLHFELAPWFASFVVEIGLILSSNINISRGKIALSRLEIVLCGLFAYNIFSLGWIIEIRSYKVGASNLAFVFEINTKVYVSIANTLTGRF